MLDSTSNESFTEIRHRNEFVPNRSCLTNLTVMEDWITRIIDDHETADIVFLDFAKAYDSVNHWFLLT